MIPRSSFVAAEKDFINFGRTKGECEDTRASDEQACSEAAYAGAAICGLSVVTLAGAGICFLAIVVADAVCYRQAERNYEICLKYNN